MDYVLTDEYLADAEKRARRFMGQWCGTSGSLAADVIRLLHDRRRILQELASMSESLADANARIREAAAARREAVANGLPTEQWYDAVGGCCDGGKCHAQADDAPQRWREKAQASAEKYAAERAIDERGPMIDVDEHIAEDDARTPEADMAVPVDWILQGQRELDAVNDDVRWTGDSILAKPAEGLRPTEADNPAEQLLLDALDVIRDRRPKYGGPRHHFKRTIGMINAAFADVLRRPLTESDWAIFMTFDKVARFLGPNKTADGPIDLAGYAACLAECEAAEAV